MFFANYGAFVHELAADYYDKKKTSQEIHLEYLKDFKKRVNAYLPNQNTFKQYFKDGSAFLRNIQMPPHDIVAVEQKAEFDIDGKPFVGYLDRVDRDNDGNLIIVDHKSRKLKKRSKRASPTKTDLELDSYLKQLYIYQKFVKEFYGEFPKKLCFNCFRSGELIEEDFDQSAYEEAIDWAKKTIEQIRRESDFNPNMEYFKCNYLCEMNEMCEFYRMNNKR